MMRSGNDPEKFVPALNEMQFGVAVDHLKKKLQDFPKLFDARASWMRNSFTHGFVRYDM
jgi:hypothetical protein